MPIGVYKHRSPSEATKNKMSETQKRIGNKPPSPLGRVLSKETRKKISNSNKRAFSEGRKLPLYGARNPAWKGGLKPLILIVRHCVNYVNWRTSCLERDNYTCQICSKRGGYLEVDHYPKSFISIFRVNRISSIEEALSCIEFWDISNGRTLCRSCHNKTKNHPRSKKTGRFEKT